MKFSTVACAVLGAFVSLSSALPTVNLAVASNNQSSITDINAHSGDSSTVPFYVTAPLNNTVYQASSTVTTTWLNGLDEQFTIVVLRGEDPHEMLPAGINLTANGRTGTYAWVVPADLVGGTYAFQYVFNLYGIPSESFSNQFKVVAAANTTA